MSIKIPGRQHGNETKKGIMKIRKPHIPVHQTQRKEKTMSEKKSNPSPIVIMGFASVLCLTACTGVGKVEALPPDEADQSLALPIFESAQELAASPWNAYFEKVYVKSPNSPSDFPLDLAEWWMLYTDYLKNINTIGGISCENFGVGDNCPITDSDNGQAICSISGDSHDVSDSVYIYHAGPYSPLPGFTWVEFTHTSDGEAQENEIVGSWMYYVPGSGNYFHLGRTIAFQDHPDAVEFFLGEECDDSSKECVTFFKNLFIEAARQGYDSIQFLAHADMTCGQNIAIEIVDVVGSGMYPCGDAIPGSPRWNTRYRAGWDASRLCDCSNTTSAQEFMCVVPPNQ